MRSHYVIAIAVALVIGFGIKALLFSNPPAEAQSQAFTSAGLDVSQMHVDYPQAKDLPEQGVEHLF
jgi:hypothetical protein